MRVADYLNQKLYEAGAETVFLVTGGMIMHLTDALLLNKNQNYVCCHHEQAAVMAAEAYGRTTYKLGVAYVTAGPGALNALTGVAGAYVDSSPCIIVSGQSKVSQIEVTEPRQFALQGYNTLPIYKQVTKYAVVLKDIKKVRYEVEKCIYLAKNGRVGPVWIECPIDIQGTDFNPGDYEGFSPDEYQIYDTKIDKVSQLLYQSQRPCIIAGAGIRAAGAVEEFKQLVNKLNIPVVISRLGMDLIEHNNHLFIGRGGTYGDRPANFTIQNSDLIISIGCRLAIGFIGHDYENFAPNAKKIVVDIDEAELNKPSINADVAIKADAKLFIYDLLEIIGDYKFQNQSWLEKTAHWKQNYPVDLQDYAKETNGINSYHFTRILSEKAPEDAIFLVDTGSCFHVHAQAFQVKAHQRHIITGGLSTMGYMPAAIGVAKALECKQNVYCITGDGSIQMNLQELQTIVHYNLPIKIIVTNNNGYLLIRHTQHNFMDGRLIGESPQTGVSVPNIKKLAELYGFEYVKINDINDIDKIDVLFENNKPTICEVMTPENQLLIPRIASKKMQDGTMQSMPYDDMFPFLPRDEYIRETTMI